MRLVDHFPYVEQPYKLLNIVSSSFMEQLNEIIRTGQALSDHTVWDGIWAKECRGEWPQMHQSLIGTQEAVKRLERICEHIMSAGGNQNIRLD